MFKLSRSGNALAISSALISGISFFYWGGAECDEGKGSSLGKSTGMSNLIDSSFG